MTSVFDSIDSTVFRSYCFWCAVLVIKMLVMSVLTGMKRHAKKAFANPEDAKTSKGKVVTNDPDVERVRRAHLNDLENIPLFFAIGFLYILTGPSVSLAVNLFRLIGISRIVHTLVYAVVVIPQPARGLAWMGAYLPTWYMAVKVLLAFI
ncbi:microsomal glutathione S-transferase 1 [Culex quinquefasciatus]|uniref:Microsomal glutathione S-transferase 1 n=1 Tax=Culex quinquefasciatus TaxID=7176 RepID=B0XG85_CULQU|nr:microsomal glutathione S-transferase 1 [Culex quinquefasciatus]|eukprot:XP_001868657.1 microsomal glutathione S-transferase 1 [Culex quinquefasciatus]